MNVPNPTPELPPRLHWFAPWLWGRRFWAVSLPLCAVSYALSMGPAQVMYDKGLLPRPIGTAAVTFYRPLMVVVGRSKRFQKPFWRYVEKWWALGGREPD